MEVVDVRLFDYLAKTHIFEGLAQILIIGHVLCTGKHHRSAASVSMCVTGISAIMAT